MTAGGLEALIELGGGDMRRTLNLLQVRCIGCGRVSGQPVWQDSGITSKPELRCSNGAALSHDIPNALLSTVLLLQSTCMSSGEVTEEAGEAWVWMEWWVGQVALP